MPEYLSPGVYVEEISTGARPIEGVSTSTAGFVGQTERGPTTPLLVTSWLDFQRRFGGYTEPTISFLPYCIKGFFDNAGQRAFVARVTRSDVTTSSLDLATSNTAQSLQVRANGPGAWGNRVFVRVMDGSRTGFRIIILYYQTQPPTPFVDPTDIANITNENRREPDATEDYDNLGFAADGPNYVLTMINGSSQLVEVEWTDDSEVNARPNNTVGSPPPGGGDPPPLFPPLTGGRDQHPDSTSPDFTPISSGDYVGDGDVATDQRRGLAGLEIIDEISILCVPDEVITNLGNIRTEIINQCLRQRDRFAVLQTTQGLGTTGAVVGSAQGLDTTYAAIYYPWIHVFDPRTQDALLIPPGGHVAGIYARTDIERGVHKAPANEVVRGIIVRDLSRNRGPLEFKVTKGQHDILNPRGINVIRDFRADGRSIRVWGARTISSDSEWKYVNVRRLFLFVEESIDEGTQWVVFEPNDEPTWAKVRRSITNFLIRVWRSGALMGATQEEAFFVKCDRSTMTQDDIDNGRLICYIGIAPVKPAEFVIFRISQKTVEATA